MRVIMDEIEVGMRIRKLNKDEEEKGLLCEIEASPWLPLV